MTLAERRITESPAPRDFDELTARLGAAQPHLPRRLAQVAAFALTRPDDIAFGTAATVAAAAGVPPSALVRFAKNLGYTGFSDLQLVFRRRLRERASDHAARIDALKRASHGELADLVSGFFETAALSLSEVRAGLDLAALDRAASVLAQARTVYLVGLRRSFPVTSYLAYALARLSFRTVLVDAVAGLGPEQAVGAGREDAVIAVSFAPYTPLTVEIAGQAKARGVPLVVVSDDQGCALSRLADVSLTASEMDFGGFRSLAATLCLAMALAAAAAARRDAP